jgi:hypothetical protein
MDDLNKRPFPREKERARKEEASSNFIPLTPRKSPRQPPQEQTSARLWIGVTWIALIVEVQQNNAHGVCVGHQRYATRTKDPDEAAAAYRAAAARATIAARITPEGRRYGNGIALAYELIRRGIAVSLDPLEEWTARSRKRELDWVDDSGALLELELNDLPLPEWQAGW